MAAGDVMNASTRTVESDFELNQAYRSTNTEPSHERRSHNRVFIKQQLATWILMPKCKNAIFSKTKQFRAIDDHRKLCKLNWAFQRTHYWIRTIQDGWDPPSWKSTWRHFFCRGWSDLDKISQTDTEWHVDCGDVWKWKPDVEFQYGGRLGKFNGMSSQSHVSHCRVVPLGEFTVTISEPHATLQDVRIPLKIVFRHILNFCF